MGHEHIFRLSFFMTNQGQICVNVFFFRWEITVGVVNVFEVLNAIVDAYVADWRPITGTNVVFDAARLDDLTDGVTFANTVIGVVGTNVGTGATPSYMAASLRMNVPSKLTRNGYKRITGLTESDVTGNVLAGVFVDTAGDDFAALVGSAIQCDGESGTGFAYPIVVGRNATGGYDLERTQDIVDAEFLPFVTTQVTRRIGVGS